MNRYDWSRVGREVFWHVADNPKPYLFIAGWIVGFLVGVSL